MFSVDVNKDLLSCFLNNLKRLQSCLWCQKTCKISPLPNYTKRADHTTKYHILFIFSSSRRPWFSLTTFEWRRGLIYNWIGGAGLLLCDNSRFMLFNTTLLPIRNILRHILIILQKLPTLTCQALFNTTKIYKLDPK